MDRVKQKLSIREVKEMDMVAYLSGLGHEPVKVRNADYWYLSPLRIEKTASFKINRQLNRWYDHGLGKGGNLVDFAVLYFGCSVSESLQKIVTAFSFHQPVLYAPLPVTEAKKITVLDAFVLSSFSLLRYLGQRQIPIAIAQRFCCELRYDLDGKTYYGIGFKNDSGGYEIRNPYFKSSSTPKGITSFDNQADTVAVFEGFMDFLSFLAIRQYSGRSEPDFIILNSLSFFEKARPFMEKHREIRLFLDRDAAGQNCSHHALSLDERYRDKSQWYAPYKDLNEWWMSTGDRSFNSNIKKL